VYFSPTLWEHRLRQRRPISRNPFEQEDSPSTNYELTAIDSPSVVEPQSFKLDDPQSLGNTNESSKEVPTKSKKNQDVEWGEQIPTWLNLVSGGTYDLWLAG
jgi:hypothetical protein